MRFYQRGLTISKRRRLSPARTLKQRFRTLHETQHLRPAPSIFDDKLCPIAKEVKPCTGIPSDQPKNLGYPTKGSGMYGIESKDRRL